MELIRQIKDAESKAKKLFEDAQKYAVQAEEKTKKGRIDRLEEARQHRKKTIEKSKEQGRGEGAEQAKEIMEKADRQLQQLKTDAAKRKESAADKIIDFLHNRLIEKTQ